MNTKDILNRIAHGRAAMLPPVGPSRLPVDTGPSLADQNWARNFIRDYTADATARPNWKPPKAVLDSLAEAHKIVAKADKLAELEQAADQGKVYVLSGWYDFL